MVPKFLLQLSCFFFLYFSSHKTYAQVARQQEYYIEIKNVNTKALAKTIDSLVTSKPAVNFFMGYKMPVLFYVLKSTNTISKKQFSEWMLPLHLDVVVFEEKKLTAKFIIAQKTANSKSGKRDMVVKKNN